MTVLFYSSSFEPVFFSFRVAYLKSKKFDKEAIARLVSQAPYLLLFSVERLDNRLGFYQKELGFTVGKVSYFSTGYFDSLL